MRKRKAPVCAQEQPLPASATVSISGELGTAQEQPPPQPVHGPGATDPMTEGYENLVAAGYQILSREPLTVYIPPGLPANDRAREEPVITEEYCQQALIDYPEVHPGWQYLFTRASELADELRRRAAEAAARGQEAE